MALSFYDVRNWHRTPKKLDFNPMFDVVAVVTDADVWVGRFALWEPILILKQRECKCTWTHDGQSLVVIRDQEVEFHHLDTLIVKRHKFAAVEKLTCYPHPKIFKNEGNFLVGFNNFEIHVSGFEQNLIKIEMQNFLKCEILDAQLMEMTIVCLVKNNEISCVFIPIDDLGSIENLECINMFLMVSLCKQLFKDLNDLVLTLSDSFDPMCTRISNLYFEYHKLVPSVANEFLQMLYTGFKTKNFVDFCESNLSKQQLDQWKQSYTAWESFFLETMTKINDLIKQILSKIKFQNVIQELHLIEQSIQVGKLELDLYGQKMQRLWMAIEWLLSDEDESCPVLMGLQDFLFEIWDQQKYPMTEFFKSFCEQINKCTKIFFQNRVSLDLKLQFIPQIYSLGLGIARMKVFDSSCSVCLKNEELEWFKITKNTMESKKLPSLEFDFVSSSQLAVWNEGFCITKFKNTSLNFQPLPKHQLLFLGKRNILGLCTQRQIQMVDLTIS